MLQFPVKSTKPHFMSILRIFWQKSWCNPGSRSSQKIIWANSKPLLCWNFTQKIRKILCIDFSQNLKNLVLDPFWVTFDQKTSKQSFPKLFGSNLSLDTAATSCKKSETHFGTISSPLWSKNLKTIFFLQNCQF